MVDPPPHAPWLPVEYELRDEAAFQAFARGKADAGQQVHVLKFIVEKICKTYDMSYRPDSERDSNFAEGKRYVGNQIVKIVSFNLAALGKKKDGRSRTSTEQPGAYSGTDAHPGSGAEQHSDAKPKTKRTRAKPKTSAKTGG